MAKEFIVNTTPQETRVALLEDGRVSELFFEREAQRGIVGNIYKGLVNRVIPGMQSAFVDLGLERDTFLYVADVNEELPENLLTPEELAGNGRRTTPIEELLRPGQEILVQVVKEPLGTKGARITSHISLPGRYLVYMPQVEHVGVSRKIVDETERRRLKTVVKALRQEHGGGGFIVRTAGAGANPEDFERDVRYLKRSWDEVRALADRDRAPLLLYRELGLVQRLLRDLLSNDIEAIRIDEPKEFARTLELVQALQPDVGPRVRLYNKSRAIFDEYGVSPDLEQALRSKVWLGSGGYLVINHTEALVAIDVNTGRYVGDSNLEETVLQTNLEAAAEIVRQIRLRDLGGIIVLDFIDMEQRRSQRRVLQALEQELRADRSPSKVVSVNEFGLIILTRKRVRRSLEKSLCQPCPYCVGAGMIKNVATICAEIYDEVKRLADDVKDASVLLRVHPDVARALVGDEASLLENLKLLVGSDVRVEGDPLLHHEQFDIVPR